MAQNYTRQSSMADGDTITAALFNNEYNQLVNAFAYSSSSASSTGHRHDGSAGQGGNIPQIGDLDFLNKVVVDGTNNRVGFFVEVSSSAVEQIRVQDGAIVPVTDNDIDLGTSSVEFKDLFLDGTAHIDTLDVDVNATVAGTLGVTGATTLSSTLAVTGAVTGSSTIQGTTITATTAFVPDASDGAALGTSALEFSDLFLADGAVINLGADQDTTLTHVADTGILLNSTRQLQFGDSGTYIHQSADGVLDLVSDTEIEINATTIDMNGALDLSGNATVGGTLGVTGAITGSSTVQGTTITATTAFVPDASDGAALGTSSLEFSDLFLADGAVISFGDDQDVTLTHVADTGLLLSSTDQLQFGDSGTYIHQSADGVLDLVSDTEIEINATTIDINGAVDISGNLDVGGNLVVTGTTTFNGGTLTLGDAASDNVVFGADVNSSIIPNTDNTYDLGSSSQEWKDIYIDGVAYLDAINFNGTAISATAAELNIMDGVTATTAELNIMDGVTATTAELNILDGVTSTAAELNILDGVTATTAELNYSDTGSAVGTVVASKVVTVDANKDVASFRNITLTGELDAGSLDISGDADIDGTLETDALSINGTTVTATAAELNILDGVTSTAAELNILDGVTSTAAELNLLDGVTATTAELNYNDTGSSVGTVVASKVVTVDANKDVSGFRNITLTDELVAASLDISGDIDVDGTTNLDVVDIDGAVDMASTLAVGGVVTANAGVVVDNFTIDGAEIDCSADMTIDVAGDLTLDVSGGDVRIKADGTQEMQFKITDGANVDIISTVADDDIRFRGNDGGSTITALTLDMSDAGAAAFNAGATFGGNVGIGGSPAFSTLEVIGDKTESNNLQLTLKGSTNTNKQMIMGFDTTADTAHVTTQIAGSAPTPLIFKTGNVVFNESSTDSDFRVESDNNANMLLVDAGNDFVGIGNSTQWGGVLNVTSSDNGNTLVLACTDTDANAGPLLSLYRSSSSSAADGDVLGTINFQGLNDANQAVTYALIENRIVDASDGAEDGRIEIATILNGTAGVSRLLMDANETAFNDNSKSLNFRVESDGNANAFSLLGSTGSVGFGVADGDVTSDGTAARTYVGIIGSGNRGRLNLGTTASNGADAGTLAFTNGANSLAELVVDTHSGVQNAGDFTLDVTGDIVFDADGGDFNFKDGGTTLLSLSNAGSNNVQISTSISNGDLLIKGNDGGSIITAATFDMSEGGAATFRGNMTMNGIAGTSPILNLVNNDTEDVNTGRESSVRFSGFRSGGEAVDNSQISGNHVGSADDDKGGLFFYTNGGAGLGERMRITNNEIIVNEDGGDQDFRIESDTDANALFVNGANGVVSFGGMGGNTRSPSAVVPKFQANSLTRMDSSISLCCNSNDALASLIMFSKTRSGNLTGATAAQAGDAVGAITWNAADGTDIEHGIAAIDAVVESGITTNDTPGAIRFYTNSGTTSASEKVRINGNGVLMVNATSQIGSGGGTTAGLVVRGGGGGPHVAVLRNMDTSGGANQIEFQDGNGDVCGAINSNATNNTTSYGTSSDYRLKENVSAVSGAIDKLKRLEPKTYNFISNTEKTKEDGFLAHELAEVIPNAVTGEKDAVHENGEMDIQQVDYGKLTPLLTAALQEAIAKIETLEAEVAALKGG